MVQITNVTTGGHALPDATGFNLHAAKFILHGHVYDPSITYHFQLNAGEGKVVAEDLYLRWDARPWLGVLIGQNEVPYNRQHINGTYLTTVRLAVNPWGPISFREADLDDSPRPKPRASPESADRPKHAQNAGRDVWLARTRAARVLYVIRVSVMRAATTRPETNVSAATSHIADGRPSASAVIPASRAPIA
jgi:hypothetical protein